MGVKGMRRLLAMLVAIALIMTSGIGVFAASSPTSGSTTKATVSGGNIKVTNTTESKVKYKLKTAKKWKTATVKNGKVTLKLKKHKLYQVKVGKKTYYRLTCKTKIKKVKKSGKKVTVKFARRKNCANKYTITAVNAKGKTVTKTVKGTKGTLKLSKGKWTIRVTVKNGKYIGQQSKAKKVTIK